MAKVDDPKLANSEVSHVPLLLGPEAGLGRQGKLVLEGEGLAFGFQRKK